MHPSDGARQPGQSLRRRRMAPAGQRAPAGSSSVGGRIDRERLRGSARRGAHSSTPSRAGGSAVPTELQADRHRPPALGGAPTIAADLSDRTFTPPRLTASSHPLASLAAVPGIPSVHQTVFYREMSRPVCGLVCIGLGGLPRHRSARWVHDRQTDEVSRSRRAHTRSSGPAIHAVGHNDSDGERRSR